MIQSIFTSIVGSVVSGVSGDAGRTVVVLATEQGGVLLTEQGDVQAVES